MLTGGALAVCGDAIAQSTSSLEEPYDKTRAASFAIFDMGYRAGQHVLFPLIVTQCHGQYLAPLTPLLKATEGTGHDASYYLAAMEQTLASQLGIVPFLYYPVFFTLTALINGLTAEQGWDRARENFIPLMKRNLLFWIPVQFVQFGFIDESLQIPFLSVCGLAWTFILSINAGSTRNYETNDDVDPVKDLSNVIEREEFEQIGKGVVAVVKEDIDVVKVELKERIVTEDENLVMS